MELLYPATCLLLLLLLLTRPGVTSGDNSGPVVVEEGSDVVLPCSLGQTDLTNQIFDWKKDGQEEVFLYVAGKHYNNGRTGQEPRFKGRVSHFEDELRNGNASIKISKTKWKDSGNYSCIFPNLQDQKFHIELVVGAASKPYITVLDETKDWSLLQCEVHGALSKPVVQWQDSSGNIVPAKEPQVTERGDSYDIILQTTVTKTDRYRCVATQEEIKHQVYSEIPVYISGPDSQSGDSTGWIVGTVVFGVLFIALLSYVVYTKYHKKQKKNEESTQPSPERVQLNSTGQK